MEKEIGKIKKNETTDIVVRIDDFGGKVGLTIREYVTGERYTGFTKAGTRISADNFPAFKELINSIALEDLKGEATEKEKEKQERKETKEKEIKETKPKRGRKKKEKAEEKEEAEETEEILEEVEEEAEEAKGTSEEIKDEELL